MKLFDYPPVWLVLAIVAAWWLGNLAPQLTFGAWARPVGMVLIVAGLAAMVLAVLEFRKARTTIVPHRAPSAIVTTGIYRYSRNPIYLGDVLVLSGLILVWQAVLAVPLVPIFALLIRTRFILPEEERLAAGFPTAFSAYVASTRRWI